MEEVSHYHRRLYSRIYLICRRRRRRGTNKHSKQILLPDSPSKTNCVCQWTCKDDMERVAIFLLLATASA